MDFTVEIKISVEDHDADVMAAFPAAVTNRFLGTAIKIRKISVKKESEEPA